MTTRKPPAAAVRRALATITGNRRMDVQFNDGRWYTLSDRGSMVPASAELMAQAQSQASALRPARGTVRVGGPKGAAVAGRRRLDPKEGDEGLIGQHLESLVKQSGLTVEEFASRIGKDKDTVILYFGGHRLPKLKDFRAIAEALSLRSLQEVLPDLPIAKRRRKS